MSTVEELRERVQAVKELGSVVRTMKMLSATRVQQYELAAKALKGSDETLERAMQALILNRPDAVADFTTPAGMLGRRSRATLVTAVVVFGSDQGLCGPFNEKLIQLVLGDLSGAPVSGSDVGINREEGDSRDNLSQRPGPVLVCGARAAMALAGSGLEPEEVLRTPSSLAGVIEVVQRVVLRVEDWGKAQRFDRLVVYYQSRGRTSSLAPKSRQLLPLDQEWLEELSQRPWPNRSLPKLASPWSELLAKVSRLWLLERFYGALVESLEGEHSSRLAAMLRAESNVERHLRELEKDLRRTRQEAITRELIEITSGFEVTSADHGGRDPRAETP